MPARAEVEPKALRRSLRYVHMYDVIEGGQEFRARLVESTDVPVIASGGVGTIEHVRQLTQIPVWGAVVGRSLYEGTLDLREALAVARGGAST